MNLQNLAAKPADSFPGQLRIKGAGNGFLGPGMAVEKDNVSPLAMAEMGRPLVGVHVSTTLPTWDGPATRELAKC